MMWFSSSDMGGVLYMDQQTADDLFGMKTSTDDKQVFLVQDPETDEPLIYTSVVDGGIECRMSWHNQNEYFQINLPWLTNHGRKKRAMVDYELSPGSGMITVKLPKVSADPAALLGMIRKLNSIIDDSTMTVKVVNNRIRISVAMELGE